MKSKNELKMEIQRIIKFIKSYVHDDESVMIPVSGGLDSDVVARLCVSALGKDRIRLFTVHQMHMEEKYLKNARNLADDLLVPLAVIEIGTMNEQLISLLEKADTSVGFHSDSLLDLARANCSLRTAIISSYQDKGYLVPANSNRSEIELGFFMPFGDNLGHFKPISHLYKSEVKELAGIIGSRKEVINQSPSAGFWEDETDLEDIAFWLYYGGPIPGGTEFSDEDQKGVEKIKNLLSQEKIDICLEQFHAGLNDEKISELSGLPSEIVLIIRNTVRESSRVKRRELLRCLNR